MTSIQTSAVVGPDGALDLHIANLPPGERVSITIDLPAGSNGSAPSASTATKSPYPNALDLLELPLEERHRILAQSVAEAAELYASDPELTAFEAFGDEDFFDDYPEHNE